MALFLCFIFLLFSSAAASCTECVKAKAAFFASNAGLSSGACGYHSEALKFYGGHTAAALPAIYKDGVGCGACFQMRCKNPAICNTRGTKFVVTDLHTDKHNTTDFVLSSRAFRAMALPGKDKQILQQGIADVEYRRVPCVYKAQNLTLYVEEFSKFPIYLAVRVLYQGGQTEIVGAEVAQVDLPSWVSMSRNYGVVWDTDTARAPKGPLQFRFIIYSGFDAQYFYTGPVLPENWKPGATYTAKAQINNVKLEGCTPCKPWK